MAAAVLTAAYVAASLSSIAPRVAWDGAYVRRQGTYAFLSYVACFLVVSFVLRTHGQVRRFVRAMLLTSVFPVAYAICQRAGFDVAVWNNPTPWRVTSTAGNPIFLGGYLIMVWPITLAFCFQAGASWRRDDRVATTRRCRLATFASAALLGAQTLAIIFTGSVGVWLGLAAGISVLLGALLDRFEFRTRVRLVIAGAVGVAVLAVVAAARRPIDIAGVSHTSQTSTTISRSGEVRVLLWRSAVELIRERPVRALVGYGPDTIRWTLGRYRSVAVRQLEGVATTDRSHNAVLDSMLTIGLIGLLGHTLVFGAICVYAMRRFGAIASISDISKLALCIAVSSTACVLLAYRLDNRGGLVPIAWAGGLVAGLMVFLFLRSIVAPQVVARNPDDLLAAALLAGVVGHYVEVQSGIATSTSELYFWIFAGLIAALVCIDAETRSPVVAAARKAGERRMPANDANTNVLVLGATSGVVLAIITFDFADRLFEPGLPLMLFGVLATATLTVGALLSSFDDDAVSAVDSRGSRADARATFFAASIGLWLTFVLVAALWIASRSAAVEQPDPETARSIEHAVSLLVALTVTILAACAAIAGSRLASSRVLGRSAPGRPRWSGIVVPSLLVAVVAAGLFINLEALHADELSGMGAAFAQAGQWQRAERFHARTLALQPNRDVYLARLGQTHLAAFRSGASDGISRLARAKDAFLAARRISPYEPDHLLQLATIESSWADAAVSADETRSHLEGASDSLAAAASLAPRDPDVWNAWGKIRLRQLDFADALALFERSLALDDTSRDTHLLYADALIGRGLDERALREYELAQTLGPDKSLPAISGRALALARLNRLTEAIEANRQALEIAPQDYTTRRNLALLYAQLGDPRRALAFAAAAAAVADASEKPAIEAFVAEMQARSRETQTRSR